MQCLDEDTVSAFISGELGPEEVAEIEQHVDGCATCRAFVAALARSATIQSITSSAGAEVELPSNDTLRRGTRIGRYEVDSLVGVGAMGAVYAAADPELHRTVALKLVRARQGAGTDEERRQLLLGEARTMAKLAHPNVVAVHDVGTYGEQIFIAMELVDGETLREWLEKSRSPQEVLATFLDAGRGLAAAHDANVVHRDFKPDNVLVGRDGRVLVTDFGLARQPLVEGERPSSIAGTPAYMAPEQLRGEDVDARADQFSFCVSLYEAVKGERPFVGKRPAELLAAIEAQSFEDAKLAPLHVRRALRRGLALSPESRFPSMRALLAELAYDPAARRRRLIAVVLLALLTIGVGAIAISSARRARDSCRAGVPAKLQKVWGPSQRASIRQAFLATKVPYADDAWTRVAAVLDDEASAWTAMHTETCDATHIRNEQSPELRDLRIACLGMRLGEMRTLIEVLGQADSDVVTHAVAAAHALSPLRRCADPYALRAVPSPPADRADAVAQLRDDLARAKALCDAGHVKESIARAEAASKKSLEVGYPPIAALAMLRLGEAQSEAREAEAASETLRRAANLADAAKDDVTRVHALTRRLFIEGFLLRHGDVIAELDQDAASAISRIGGDVELDGNRQHALGMALLAKNSLPEAGTALEAAIELRAKAHGNKSRQVAMSRNGLCLVLDSRGDREKALAECLRAIDIWTEILGPKHPDVAIGLINVGAMLDSLGRWVEGGERYEASLAISEEALGPEHPLVVMALTNLGESLSMQGKHPRALALQQRALGIREKLEPGVDPRLEVVQLNLGNAYLRSGDARKARDAFELAWKRWPSTGSAEERGELEIGLASALWAVDESGTRERARRIAVDGRTRLPEGSSMRRTFDKWLAEHR